jgi:hypothetical protein
MIWREFEGVAPELAALGKARFDQSRVALIATIRRDGSPRISPIEPYFVLGHLLLGVMTRSAKSRDLARDARCAIHSSITDINGSEGDFRLHGRANLVTDEIRDSAYDAWWKAHPADACVVLSVAIDAASFVAWDIAQGEMTLTSWSPGPGQTVERRAYP